MSKSQAQIYDIKNKNFNNDLEKQEISQRVLLTNKEK